jgi:hypothetical protein
MTIKSGVFSMKLFLSLETYFEVGEILRSFLVDIESKLAFVTTYDIGLEKNNNYGTEFEGIGIIPTCIPESFMSLKVLPERILIKRKAKDADIRLRIPYEEFFNASLDEKRRLYVENIIKSILAVQSRSKLDFQGYKLIDDILLALDYKKEEFDILK